MGSQSSSYVRGGAENLFSIFQGLLQAIYTVIKMYVIQMYVASLIRIESG